ncbi:MAG: DNA methyltransferase [Actinomycetes bacterium]
MILWTAMTMSRQTISSTGAWIPESIEVSRGDAVYMAHSYLTKVPPSAIMPFIKALTAPGDTVLDPFAGSGMTGVAALMLGRNAVLYDISVLGQHIGGNYANLIGAGRLREAAHVAMESAGNRVGPVYSVRCEQCGGEAELSRSVWSVVLACPNCQTDVVFYESLAQAGWTKSAMTCAACGTRIVARGTRRVGEAPVLDTVSCRCSPKLRDQTAAPPLHEASADGLKWPDVPIGKDRQMYQASALGRHGLDSTARFFSARNLVALTALRDAIGATEDAGIRSKLMFAFTAVLARASKRYQWSRQRPLNAANQNYYIAPVFYEWNVFDLYRRKVEAIIRSDDLIRTHLAMRPGSAPGSVEYRLGSARRLALPDNSIDYVFTDPPFGSNIFYSDMNLFQEAWLGDLTDHTEEAVVDRAHNGGVRRTAGRYESILTEALQECARVLKPGKYLSLVFSNSSGRLWSLVERATRNAGFVIDPDALSVLNKGQRSIKGLAGSRTSSRWI